MGVLNVTPDSFSDGGRHGNPREAVAHGLRMVADGADIIDVGGESTRPGAEPVSEAEELARVMPVVEGLLAAGVRSVSIDTTKPCVARRSVEAGASIVNDIRALQDPGMLQVVAESGAAVVLMHMRGTPATMQRNVDYTDVVAEVRTFLRDRAEAARRAGVAEIAIDPGLGFGKSARQNFVLLARLRELAAEGYPVLIGPSRKSFLGSLDSRLPVGERLEGTMAAVSAGVTNGARIVRVHDVRACRRVLDVLDAVASAAAKP